MSTAPAETVAARAGELAQDGSSTDAAEELLSAAGGNRHTIEVARDLVAGRLRANVTDFEATATLRILNRALSALPINDPLDWKVRWGQRFRRP